jgi:hypothetical protein
MLRSRVSQTKPFEYVVGFVSFRNRKLPCIEAGDNIAIIDIRKPAKTRDFPSAIFTETASCITVFAAQAYLLCNDANRLAKFRGLQLNSHLFSMDQFYVVGRENGVRGCKWSTLRERMWMW